MNTICCELKKNLNILNWFIIKQADQLDSVQNEMTELIERINSYEKRFTNQSENVC